MRNGGSGGIGAGDGWAVGGTSGPIIAHYDGFSWQIMASPDPNAHSTTERTSAPAPARLASDSAVQMVTVLMDGLSEHREARAQQYIGTVQH